MNIGIFGGSFNPVHNGHLLIARQMLDFKIVSQVWLLPCYSHVWDKKLEGPNHRTKMLQIALGEVKDKRIKLSLIELSLKKPSYTIDTVKLIIKKFPEHNFSWIIGSDNLQNFGKWHKVGELCRLIHFYIAPKGGIPLPNALPENMEAVSNPLWVETNISSTIIRERIAKGIPLNNLVPDKVSQYIQQESLYNIRP